MAINFPSSPSVGQISDGFIYRAGGWWERVPMATALPENMIVNPAILVSQENGDTAGTTSGYYAADQWRMLESAATGVLQAARLPSASANGSPYRLRLYTTTAQASLAVSEYAGYLQDIEGYRIADLRWGTPNAIPAVLRFWAAGTTGLVQTVTIRNAVPNIRISFPFTLTPGWVKYEFAVPAETTAVWGAETAKGAELWFTAGAGSNHMVGTPGEWLAGSAISLPGQSNIFGAVAQQLLLCDVGLYADPYGTGMAPPFEIGDYATELRNCQRYWYRAMGLRGGAASATSAARLGSQHPVQMRIAPAITAVGAPKIFDGIVTPTVGSPAGNLATVNSIEGNWTSSGLTAQRPLSNYWDSDSNYFAANARM
jgi:hypothetical protein